MATTKNCPPPSTAYAPMELPTITPICDTGALVKENYAEAFAMAMQIFALACKCMKAQEQSASVVAVNPSQQFTGARIP